MVEASVKTKRWTCPACSSLRTAPYCSRCGEEPLRPRDLTAYDLAAQLFKTLTSIDGRLLRSFRLLLERPGALTVAHLRGNRRAYLGPLKLFLIANALFFLLQSLTHTDIFSSPLSSHLHRQDWGALAERLVAGRLEAKHMTLAAYAPLFDQAAKLNAKALIVLMVLAFAPFMAVLLYSRHQPIGAHLIFSFHLYVFVLLLFCVSLLIMEVSMVSGGPGLTSAAMDMAISAFNLVACAIYLFMMLGTVYELKPVARTAASALLAVIVAGFVPGYRFVIFIVTLYTT